MIPLTIANIDLRMKQQEFETEISSFENNYPTSGMTHNSTETQMRKSGQEMYQIDINSPSGSELRVVAERDAASGDIVFRPLKIRSVNKSFYQTTYADPDEIGQETDPGVFFSNFMQELCKKKKGTCAMLDPTGHMFIYKNGVNMDVESMALIDTSGNIYSLNGAETLGDMSDGEKVTSFKIKTFWKDWLADHRDIAGQMNAIPDAADKFNFFGKALIQKKMSGEIEFEEFNDIFMQICAYGVITDKTVLNFYQLLN